MILTLDIGNTNIKAGVFNGPELVDYWRISTDRTKSSDEYGILLLNLFAHSKIDPAVDGIIMSSVVPTINFTIEHMCSNYFNQTPMQVVPGIKTGINLKYENPRELGSDRIVNAVAAYELYGGPCIFIDFGTATTFGVVSERGEFLGGAICPGIKLASEALTERTSRLPKIELVKPESVIGRNTVSNMQSGLVYGFIGQVTYLIDCMKRELGAPNAKVIATGGMSRLIASGTDAIDEIDGLLTLKGLRIIYERNQPRA
ncbi:MAG: type III pantothenate kinase [Clostridiales bacterium]|nr:type III pantothenate kinase [Clostridiales bacterium]MDY4200430.1 type III pantothenate kinase [Candidatus Fimadaptatus sp.]